MGKLLIPTVSTMHPLNHAFCTPNFANIGEFLINFDSLEKEMKLWESVIANLMCPSRNSKYGKIVNKGFKRQNSDSIYDWMFSNNIAQW